MPVPKKTTDDIKATVNQIRKLLDSHEKIDCLVRYKVGVAVCNAEKKYGDQTVEKIARQLGCDDSTLHQYAQVARAWPKEAEFKKLCATKAKGVLTFSHFISLSGVAENTRDVFLDQVVKNGWNVGDLKAEIAKTRKPGSQKPTPTIPPIEQPESAEAYVAVELSQLISNHKARIEEQARLTQTISLLSKVKANEVLAKQVDQLIEFEQEIRTALDNNLTLLQSVQKHIAKDLAR